MRESVAGRLKAVRNRLRLYIYFLINTSGSLLGGIWRCKATQYKCKLHNMTLVCVLEDGLPTSVEGAVSIQV